MAQPKKERKYQYPVDDYQIRGAALIRKVGPETFGEIADVIKGLGWANTDILLKTLKTELALDALEAAELKPPSPTMGEDPKAKPDPGLDRKVVSELDGKAASLFDELD